MTITLAPDPNPRRIDRAAQPKRHTGPYYGSQLRRVLAPEPTDPSFIDRVADYYFEHRWPTIVLLVLGAAFLAASIMFLAGCALAGGCLPGETRCEGVVVEECVDWKGWQRKEVCETPYTCVIDRPSICGTHNVACCGQVKS